MHTQSLFHRTLRVSSVLVSLTLLFSSDLLGTQQLADHAERYAANVIGVGASVAPNELNVITAELTRREQELALREREIDARAVDPTFTLPIRDFILSGILLLLLSLIVLNYILDYRRRRSYPPSHEAMA